MLETDVYLPEFTKLFLRFKQVIGDEFWLKRVQSINVEICGYPYLKEYLIVENSIAYDLTLCSELIKKYGIIPRRQRQNKSLFPTIKFIVQVLSFIDSSSVTQRPAFIRRIQSSFRNPDDLRGLLFEFTVATHFIKRGNNVTWPEVGEVGSPDLLIKDIGTNGLDIECKSISNNKGRKIHGREALEFFNLMQTKLKGYIESSSFEGGMAVVVNIPDRLPKSLKDRQVLVERTLKVIMAESSQSFSDGYEIKLSYFDLSLLEGVDLKNLKSKDKRVRQLVDKLSQTDNREVMIIGTSKKSVVVVLQANREDAVIGYLFETLSQSSKKQLSKIRPAIYMVEFTSVNAKELRNLAAQDFDIEQKPTGLNIRASHFLSNIGRQHIVGVGFLSNIEIGGEADGSFVGSGAAYFFPQKASEFWHDDFSGMFFQG